MNRVASSTARGLGGSGGRRRWLTSSPSFLLLAGNLGASLLGMAAGIVAARVLGPTGRGDLAVITFWPAIIGTIGSLGLAEAVPLELSRQAGSVRGLVGKYVVLAATGSLLSILLGWGLIPCLLTGEQQHLVGDTRWYLSYIAVWMLGLVSGGALLAAGRFRAVFAVRLSTAGVWLLCTAALAWFGLLTAQWAAALIVIVTALGTVVPFLLLPRGKPGKPTPGTTQAPPFLRSAAVLLKTALALHVSRLLFLVYEALDRGMANLSFSQEEIGYYQVVVSFTVAMAFVPNALSQVILSRAAQLDLPERRQLFLVQAVRTGWLTGAVAVFAVAAMPVAIPVLYGAGFQAAIVPTQLMALAVCLSAVGAVLQAAAKAEGHPGWCSVAEGAAVVTLIVTGLLLVHLGPIGLIAAVCAARLVALCVVIWGTGRATLGERRSLLPWRRPARMILRRDIARIWNGSSGHAT